MFDLKLTEHDFFLLINCLLNAECRLLPPTVTGTTCSDRKIATKESTNKNCNKLFERNYALYENKFSVIMPSLSQMDNNKK